ncbi:MAG: hypothetical protein EBR81_03140, partial [Proteobacteria bacterium]|nr:hypothetical protein [Pseudomonadota bacterium]
FRQLTIDDMARKAAERVRNRSMMLKHIGEPGCPRLLLEASAALLRRGLCADARARVLAYVLDDTRRLNWRTELIWLSTKRLRSTSRRRRCAATMNRGGTPRRRRAAS